MTLVPTSHLLQVVRTYYRLLCPCTLCAWSTRRYEPGAA